MFANVARVQSACPKIGKAQNYLYTRAQIQIHGKVPRIHRAKVKSIYCYPSKAQFDHPASRGGAEPDARQTCVCQLGRSRQDLRGRLDKTYDAYNSR